MIVGLWKFCGDEPRAAARVGMPHTEHITTELADVLREIGKGVRPAETMVDRAAGEAAEADTNSDAIASAARP